MEMWFGIGSDDEEIEEETEDMVMSRRPPPPLPSYEYITQQIQDVQRQYEDWVVRMESSIFSEDDPRYVSPMHNRGWGVDAGMYPSTGSKEYDEIREEGRKRAAEAARKKREEKEAEEAHNMKMWGRKDDPRLDPTSEFFDPLKLVHKDIE